MSNIRRVLRKPAVMAAFGIKSNSSFYLKISRGFLPQGVKMDPDGRAVVWFEDEIEAIQQVAIENAQKKSAA